MLGNSGRGLGGDSVVLVARLNSELVTREMDGLSLLDGGNKSVLAGSFLGASLLLSAVAVVIHGLGGVSVVHRGDGAASASGGRGLGSRRSGSRGSLLLGRGSRRRSRGSSGRRGRGTSSRRGVSSGSRSSGRGSRGGGGRGSSVVGVDGGGGSGRSGGTSSGRSRSRGRGGAGGGGGGSGGGTVASSHLRSGEGTALRVILVDGAGSVQGATVRSRGGRGASSESETIRSSLGTRQNTRVADNSLSEAGLARGDETTNAVNNCGRGKNEKKSQKHEINFLDGTGGGMLSSKCRLGDNNLPLDRVNCQLSEQVP